MTQWDAVVNRTVEILDAIGQIVQGRVIPR